MPLRLSELSMAWDLSLKARYRRQVRQDGLVLLMMSLSGAFW